MSFCLLPTYLAYIVPLEPNHAAARCAVGPFQLRCPKPWTQANSPDPVSQLPDPADVLPSPRAPGLAPDLRSFCEEHRIRAYEVRVPSQPCYYAQSGYCMLTCMLWHAVCNQLCTFCSWSQDMTCAAQASYATHALLQVGPDQRTTIVTIANLLQARHQLRDCPAWPASWLQYSTAR